MPNHVCGEDPFADGFPVIGTLTEEQIARKKQQDKECAGRSARLARDLAEEEEREFDKRAKEERRQLEMRLNHKKWLEERRAQKADVETPILQLDLKDQ